MEIKTSIDGLESVVMKVLKEYGDEGAVKVSDAVEAEAEKVRKDIRQNIASSGISSKHTKYKRGWQIKKASGKLGITQCTIYNGPEYRITHLLEKGHVSKNQYGGPYGSVKAYPHIAKATENMEPDLLKKIKDAL